VRPRSTLPYLACILLAAAIGRADRDIPITLAVSAPAECADGPSFLTSLRARAGRVRAAVDGEVGRTVRVEISRRDAVWIGSVLVADAAPRTLEAATCADAVSALSFVTALALEREEAQRDASAPSASTAPSSTTLAPSTPSTLPTAAASGVGATPSIAATSSIPIAASAPGAASPASDLAASNSSSAPSHPTRRAPLEVAAGFDVSTAGAVGSVVMPRVGVGYASRSDALFAPSLQIAFAPGAFARAAPSFGEAQFRWTTGTVDACPLRLAIGSALLVRPCAGLDAGLLYGEGATVLHPTSSSRPWLAARALIRAQVSVGEFLFVGAEIGAALPVVRDTFYMDPGHVTVYRAPWLLPFWGLSLGMRFS
jgi:hypothetical protein